MTERKEKQTNKKKTEYIVVDGRKYYKYHGNYVTKTGEFFNKHFKKIIPKDGMVWFTDFEQTKEGQEKKKRRRFRAGKIVIEACTGMEVSKSDIIEYIDGDETNYELSNLKVVSRKEYFKGHNWEKLYKYPEAIREKIVAEYNYEERAKHFFRGKWSKPTCKELGEKYDLNSLTVFKYITSDLKKKGIEPRKRERIRKDLNDEEDFVRENGDGLNVAVHDNRVTGV